MLRKAFCTSLLIASLLLVALPEPVTSAEPANVLDWPTAQGRFFTQANGFPSGLSPKGFAITDQDGIPFWSEFQRLGGVNALGYPISRRFQLHGFTCQAVQRGILQWQPQERRAALLNVFDLLHEQGKDVWLLAMRSTPRPLLPDFDKGKDWGQVVQSRLALLDPFPAIKARYFAVKDPLTYYGLPTSKVEDMGNHWAVRLQRAVIQQWKVDVPWAKAGQTTVANGGDVAKEAGFLPYKSDRLEDPPKGTWAPTPQKYRFEALSTWYGEPYHGRVMACGEIYDMNNPTIVASNMYPFGTKLSVTSKITGKSTVVTIKDTGAFKWPIAVDLSYAAFSLIDNPRRGKIPVIVEVVP